MEVRKRKPHCGPFGTTHATPAATAVAVRRIRPGRRLELADVFDAKLFLCLGPKECHILAGVAANATHEATKAARAQVNPPQQISPQYLSVTNGMADALSRFTLPTNMLCLNLLRLQINKLVSKITT
jgi:hypothetical protein